MVNDVSRDGKMTTYELMIGRNVEVALILKDKEYRVFGKLVEFFERNQALLLKDYGVFLVTDEGLKEVASGENKYIEVRAWVWIREI